MPWTPCGRPARVDAQGHAARGLPGADAADRLAGGVDQRHRRAARRLDRGAGRGEERKEKENLRMVFPLSSSRPPSRDLPTLGPQQAGGCRIKSGMTVIVPRARPSRASAPSLTCAPASAVQLRDHPVERRGQRMLHLHRLERQQALALGNLVARSTSTAVTFPGIGASISPSWTPCAPPLPRDVEREFDRPGLR